MTNCGALSRVDGQGGTDTDILQSNNPENHILPRNQTESGLFPRKLLSKALQFPRKMCYADLITNKFIKLIITAAILAQLVNFTETGNMTDGYDYDEYNSGLTGNLEPIRPCDNNSALFCRSKIIKLLTHTMQWWWYLL